MATGVDLMFRVYLDIGRLVVLLFAAGVVGFLIGKVKR